MALTALLVRTLFAVPYLPTNDGPEHLFASHVENHFGDAGTLYAAFLEPTTEFAARGFSLVFGPLEAALGWRLGQQCALAILALLSAYGFSTLVRAVDPRRLPLAFLGFPLALTWELYMGFFPFVVGSGVGLFVLALAVRWRQPSSGQRAIVGFLLLLQAVCHVFSAVLTGLALLVLLVSRGWEAGSAEGRSASRGAVRELLWAAAIGLPAAMVLLASVLLGGSLRKSPFGDDFLRLPMSMTLEILPRLVAPGPLWRAVPLVVLVLVAIAVGVSTVTKRSSTDRAFILTGVVLLALGVASPMNIPGWQFFSPRFLPLGVLLCLATLPIERLARPAIAHAVAAAVLAFAMAWLLTSVPFHRRLAASSADAIAALSPPVARHAMWLPITLAPEGGLPVDPTKSEVPFLAPLRHIPMLYALVDGGLTPYTFANNAATYPFVVRADGPKAPPIPSIEKYAPVMESDVFDAGGPLRTRVLSELATYGMFYEAILVTGALPSDVALFGARGFATDARVGSVLRAHFVPCRLDLRVPSTGEVPLVDVGVAEQTILRDETRPATMTSDRERHLVLPNAPCGDVWVRPHREAKRGDGSVATRFCEGADGTGKLPARLTWTSGAVDCAMSD